MTEPLRARQASPRPVLPHKPIAAAHPTFRPNAHPCPGDPDSVIRQQGVLVKQPQAEQGLLIPGGWPQPVCTHEPAGEYKAAGCVFSHLGAVHEAYRSGTVRSGWAGHPVWITLASYPAFPRAAHGCCAVSPGVARTGQRDTACRAQGAAVAPKAPMLQSQLCCHPCPQRRKPTVAGGGS